MPTWQPAQVLYPDVELVLCDATRALDLGVDVVAREVPQMASTRPLRAIVWNRIGGVDPDATVQGRVFAPSEKEANDLVRLLVARLPAIVDGHPVLALTQVGGPTDLGEATAPMRQVIYDVRVRGVQQ